MFPSHDRELLLSQNHKKVLIWVDINWFWTKFFIDQINADIYDILKQLLPSYEFRIITDKSILELAIKKVGESYEGVYYEVSNNNNDTINNESSMGQKLQKASTCLCTHSNSSHLNREPSECQRAWL